MVGSRFCGAGLVCLPLCAPLEGACSVSEPGGLTKKIQSCPPAFCRLVEKETQIKTVVLILS